MGRGAQRGGTQRRAGPHASQLWVEPQRPKVAARSSHASRWIGGESVNWALRDVGVVGFQSVASIDRMAHRLRLGRFQQLEHPDHIGAEISALCSHVAETPGGQAQEVRELYLAQDEVPVDACFRFKPACVVR